MKEKEIQITHVIISQGEGRKPLAIHFPFNGGRKDIFPHSGTCSIRIDQQSDAKLIRGYLEISREKYRGQQGIN